MDADEVTQVYIQYPSLERMPLKELKAFKRVHLRKDEAKTVQYSIPVQELQKWDLQQKQWRLYTGEYRILVGANSQDIRLTSSIEIK